MQIDDLFLRLTIFRFNTDGCGDILENTEKVFKNGYIDASKREYFAGLRPVSADDIPIIGKPCHMQFHHIYNSKPIPKTIQRAINSS